MRHRGTRAVAAALGDQRPLRRDDQRPWCRGLPDGDAATACELGVGRERRARAARERRPVAPSLAAMRERGRQALLVSAPVERALPQRLQRLQRRCAASAAVPGGQGTARCCSSPTSATTPSAEAEVAAQPTSARSSPGTCSAQSRGAAALPRAGDGGRPPRLRRERPHGRAARASARAARDSWELVPAGASWRRCARSRTRGARAHPRRRRARRRRARGACSRTGLAGRSERDVAIELELRDAQARRRGPSFPSIVAAGAHAALPTPSRAMRRSRRPARHDRLGRAARWLLLGLHPHLRQRRALPSEAREIYELVLCAQQAGLAALRAGTERQGGRRRRARGDRGAPATASTSATASATASAWRSTRAPASRAPRASSRCAPGTS